MSPHAILPKFFKTLQANNNEQQNDTPRLSDLSICSLPRPRSQHARQARKKRKAIRQQQKQSRRQNR